MKKTIFLTILLILVPLLSYGQESNNQLIEEEADLFINEDLNSFIDDLVSTNEIAPDIDIKHFLTSIVSGKESIDINTIFSKLGNIFFQEINDNLKLLSQILIVAIISAILNNMQTVFEGSSISGLANYVTYILLAILIIGSFYQIVEITRDTITSMVNFMQVILPVLLTLLVLAGGPNTKLIFHPMIVATVNVIGSLVKNVIFPLVHFSFIISILSNLSQRMELKKLSELGRQIIVFIISASFTVFIGIITIYGLSTKIDGITIRTAKFAVDKFVPIVGGFLSDAVETVIGSSMILKNGIGIIGLIALILITAIPIIKISTLLLIYKITGAVVEPIVSKNVSNLLNDVSKSFLLILISTVSVAIMFFITITIIVDTGNNLLMIR